MSRMTTPSSFQSTSNMSMPDRFTDNMRRGDAPSTRIPWPMWIILILVAIIAVAAIILWLTKSSNKTQIGATCTANTDCATGLVCTANKCAIPVLNDGVGATCTTAANCATGLVCTSSKCALPTPVNGLGDTCSATAVCATGLTCNTSNKCECSSPTTPTNIEFANNGLDVDITWTPSLNTSTYEVVIWRDGNTNPILANVAQSASPLYKLLAPVPDIYTVLIVGKNSCGRGPTAAATGAALPLP